MTHDFTTFGTAAYTVVTNRQYGYHYILRQADQAVTHLSVCSDGYGAYVALHEIYARDPEQFEMVCREYTYYPAPDWENN